MKSITIDILNEKAWELIKKLEELNLVKVTKESNISKVKKKPSDYKGIIPSKLATDFQQYIGQSRSEWE